jgi:hypothetical protein
MGIQTYDLHEENLPGGLPYTINNKLRSSGMELIRILSSGFPAPMQISRYSELKYI